MNRPELERRARAWRRHHRTQIALLALGVTTAVAALLLRFASAPAALVLGALIGIGAGLIRWRRRPTISPETIAFHLNRTCATLEESAALWLRPPESLTLVETLQRRRLDAAWAALPDRERIGYPVLRGLRAGIGAAIAGCTLLATSWLWPAVISPQSAAVASRPPAPPASAPPPLALRDASIVVTPPAYLGREARRIDGLDGEVEEGAALAWEFAASGSVAAINIENTAGGDALAAERIAADAFRARATMGDTRIYQVTLVRADGQRQRLPQIHTLKILRDRAPTIAWLTPTLSRTMLDPARETSLPVRLTVTDDHGVADVALVVTVAKGSGEGVKFREQRFPLVREAATTAYGLTLDLRALRLEPGDEIYFHAEATDHRAPLPNRSRSETRFVVLRGPAAELSDPGNTMSGVKFVPAYFRSQRQLIIDTEALITAKPSLPPGKFHARAEEIGVDQKLLRLRYGQFLGEEFEPDAAGAPKEAQAMSFAARLRGRAADPGDRTAAIERAAEAQHNHAPSAAERDGRPATMEEIRAPFVHVHDNAEVATVFDEKVKAALRAILAAMWEAEGLLRTGQPEAALAPENRALELLKELQRTDRVYVRRVGFEPAPLKIDERRLRGELESIPKSTRVIAPPRVESPDAAALQATLDALTRGTVAAMPPAAATAVDARLTHAARAEPEKFVAALELWRRRDAGLNPTETASLQRTLRLLLPARHETPAVAEETQPALAARYFERLQSESPPAR